MITITKKKYNPKNGIVIRHIKEDTIIRLDRRAEQLSERLNQKISRQDYIKMILEGENAKPINEIKKELLEQTIEKFTNIMEQQMETFERYIESNEILIELLSGVEREKEND